MTRSLWKGPFVDASLLKATPIRRVWSRRSCILPQFVGLRLQIYNGQKCVALKITEEMVGHKFGEFAATRHRRTSTRIAGKKGGRPPKRP
jgi:small subunit ribosomal protein S19